MIIYRKPRIRNRLMEIYEDKLSDWPVPFECFYVPTRYGDTHIVACGRKDAFPLVLIPGLAVTAMMWLPNISALSSEYRCYAFDVIGDYGKSALENPHKYIKSGKAYSDWLGDVFEGLGIQKAHIVGASNGGYITLNQAIYTPDKIGRIVLLAPVGLNLTITQILPKIFYYLFVPTESNRERLIHWFLGDDLKVREAIYEQLWLGIQGLPKVPIPIILSGSKLRKIKAPALFIFGENDPAISAHIGKRRVNKYLPGAQVLVVPGAGHVLNYEEDEFINNQILKFLGET